MKYASPLSHFAPYFTHKASPKSNTVVKKPSVLRRIYDAIVESRQKHADQMIALWVARAGGRFTDNIEREITQRLLTDNWSARDRGPAK